MVMADYLVASHDDYRLGPRSEFVLGADLGQSIDPTAISLVERLVQATGRTDATQGRMAGATNLRAELAVSFRLRAVELLPLGTRYQNVVGHLAMRVEQASTHGPCALVFDETGARAAGDMIRAAVPDAIACVLTGGEDDNRTANHRWSVSKPNMVTGLLAAIENTGLELADDLTDLDRFKAHLVDLRRKISSLGHMSFNAREGGHDDYVTAAGLAFWWATKYEPGARVIRLEGAF